MHSRKNEFTVKQAVEYATKNATQVKNALLDVKVQQQVNRQITAAAYPQVSASFGLTDYLEIPTSLIPSQIFGGPSGTFEAVKFGTKYNANGGFDVSQILFDGQVFVGLKARSAVLDFYVKSAAVTQEQIKANVMKIYYQLVVGQSQLASLDANIERFEKLLKDTKEIYKNGFAEKLDVDKVQVQLNNIKTEKEKIVNIITSQVIAALKFL